MQENLIDDTKENTIGKWWQQEAFVGQRPQGSYAPEQGKNQARLESASVDAASLLAEELRRRDAHIAKLEAMLRQAQGTPTEHERRPEAFLLADDPEHTAGPSDTPPASPNGALAYDAPPVMPESAADSADSSTANNEAHIGGAMVYDAPAAAPRDTRLRLEDMKLEPSPIAQIVMQAAAQRLAESVPVFEPTLRMSSQAARSGSAANVQGSPPRRRQIAVVSALGLLAFAGVIGASQLRAPRNEPMLIAPPPPIDMAAFAVAPVKVSKPDAANAMRTTDFSNSSIEILPVTPVPQTIKHSARHTGSAHIAAVPRSVPGSEPLSASAAAHTTQYPVHVVHTVQSHAHAIASTAKIHKSVAPPVHAETSGVIVEADEEHASAVSAFHSDTSLPPDSAEAAVRSHRTEVLPEDTQDTYGDSRASNYRARRRGYRYSESEPTETRRSGYKYGEGMNRRSGDDTEFARRPGRRYNERTDSWTDERPDR